MTCYALLQFILFKMSINTSIWNEKLTPSYSFYKKQSFSRFVVYFYSRATVKFFKKLFLVLNHPMKNKSQWSADFLGDIGLIRAWIRLREVDSSYAGNSVELPSTAIIFAQNDMKYLGEVNLEQLLYESSHGGMVEKSVKTRSFFWSVYSFNWTEYGHLLCKSPHSVGIQENKD